MYGGETIDRSGNFVKPTIASIHHDASIVHKEVFAPILYVISFKTLGEAIGYNNEVKQGLSSSLYTNNLQNAFEWIGYVPFFF